MSTDVFKQFEKLRQKRDAMRLRIKKMQEQLELLDAEVELLQKEVAKQGLLRDLPPA